MMASGFILFGFVTVCCQNARAFHHCGGRPSLGRRRALHQTHTSRVGALNSSALDAVDSFYRTMPLASAFLTCGVKASLADTVAQTRTGLAISSALEESDGSDTLSVEATSPFDSRRNVAFLLYGGLYQGMAQEIIFNEGFPLVFGHGTDAVTVLSKVACDSFLVTPLLCLPVAYVVKSVIFDYSIQEALSRYVDDVINNKLLIRYWSLWGPMQCLTFGVVPEHLRIAFIAAISFIWVIIFSSITAQGERDRYDKQCQLEDGVSCRIDG
mmetsp:Transcript_18424/g.43009  ORF Transcript_18424/g.43009 Transcript_18424/m.43009 type:complete len:269 (-) Transcript_18424:107-913(-)